MGYRPSRLRGSRDGLSPGVHILHAFSTKLGAVITGDAAFSFESVVKAIRDGGGDYFLFVKGNQPELKSEIAHAFGDVSPLKGDV